MRALETQLAAKAPRLKDGKPNIRQPESGNRPAQEVIPGDARKKRVMTDKIILGPERDPWQNEQKHANLEAEHDVDDSKEATHSL